MYTAPRNAPCPCGSGKKYKHCHLGKTAEIRQAGVLIPLLVLLTGLGAAAYAAVAQGIGLGLAIAGASAILAGLIFILREPPPPTKGGDPGAINFGG